MFFNHLGNTSFPFGIFLFPVTEKVKPDLAICFCPSLSFISKGKVDKVSFTEKILD